MLPPIESTRKWHLDLLRVIAIIFVLYNHTNTRGYWLFSVAQNSLFYWFYLSVSILIIVAVPLFFMVSGALLLGKDEKLIVIMRKRVLRMAVVLVVSSLILFIYQHIKANDIGSQTMKDFLVGLYSGTIATPLWFMYSYIAFLFMLPFLRKLAQSMSKADYRWLVLVFLASQLIVCFDILIQLKGGVPHSRSFSFFISTPTYCLYSLMGFYFEKCVSADQLTMKRAGLLCLAGFLCIVATYTATTAYCEFTGNWSEASGQVFFGSLTCVPAFALFYSACVLSQKWDIPTASRRIISTFGSASFGIYLLEGIWRDATIGVYNTLLPILHSFLACWVWILVAGLLGFCVTMVLKRIPIVNRFV